MSFIDDSTRSLVPRWHFFDRASKLGENAGGARQNNLLRRDDYEEKVSAWRASRTLVSASELVGSALVHNVVDDGDAIDAARKIMGETTLLGARKAASCLLEPSAAPVENSLPDGNKQDDRSSDLASKLIQVSRRRVRSDPRDALAWMDLALCYTSTGMLEKARKAVSVATGLNPHARHIVRSAARFYLHSGEKDRAIDVVRRATGSKIDPWIIAAEIGVSSALGLDPKRLREARNIEKRGEFTPFHRSELLMTMASLELREGTRRVGRRLLTAALVAPTENSIAQAVALRASIGAENEERLAMLMSRSDEANARGAADEGEYARAVDGARNWSLYQPFSKRPIIFGTYYASTALGDHAEAVNLGEMGLRSNPGDVMISNNLAFSLMHLGELDRAESILSSVDTSDFTERSRAIGRATEGLLAYRRGDVKRGKVAYHEAIAKLTALGDARGALLAHHFLISEEERIAGKELPEREEISRLAVRLGLKEIVRKKNV